MAGEERNIKVKIDGVRKVFNGRSGEMVALNGINMDILDNEFVCVVGPSGCGKSTLWKKGSGNRSRAWSRVPAVCVISLADSEEKCRVWSEAEKSSGG